MSCEDIVPLVKDLRARCFECIDFIFELNSTQIVFLFEHCSSLLSELLPAIAGTFWLDGVVPDWRMERAITDQIMKAHVQHIADDVKKLHQFEVLVNKSTKLMETWIQTYKPLEKYELYQCFKKLRGYHILIHEKMTEILTAMKPRIKPIIGHLRNMQETGRQPRTKKMEMLLHRLMQI